MNNQTLSTFTVNWQGVILPIHPATIHYIGGMPAHLEWDERDDRFHEVNEDSQSALEEARRAAEEAVKSGSGQKNLQDFLVQAMEIFSQLLLTDDQAVARFLGPKKWIFVIGGMRTGGTFMYRELCGLHQIDYTQFPQGMTHDSIPSAPALNFWQQPNQWIRFAFEMAQYLTWVKREQFNQDTIIQKRISYGHCLPLLDHVFFNSSSSLDYVITLRHPQTMGDSFAKLVNIDPKQDQPPTPSGWEILAEQKQGITSNQWKTMSYHERVLSYWEIYHQNLVRFGQLRGHFIPLAYGSDYESYLQKVKTELDSSYDFKSFKPKAKVSESSKETERYNEIENRMMTFWKIHGYNFPKLDLI